jgi:hypothetical protein
MDDATQSFIVIAISAVGLWLGIEAFTGSATFWLEHGSGLSAHPPILPLSSKRYCGQSTSALGSAKKIELPDFVKFIYNAFLVPRMNRRNTATRSADLSSLGH